LAHIFLSNYPDCGRNISPVPTESIANLSAKIDDSKQLQTHATVWEHKLLLLAVI